MDSSVRDSDKFDYCDNVMNDNCLNVTEWLYELHDDPDFEFLSQGLIEGFNLVDENVMPMPVECNNYVSATDVSVREAVETQILNEIANNNYVICNKRPTIVSALGAIPKANSNDIRLIHDCSRPVGTGLNDFATKCSVKYQTIDEAVTLSTPNCFYAKVDLKSAYRSVNIHPDNYKLTGLKWVFKGESEPTYIYDKRLPFGARKSPAIFHRLTQAIRRMMGKKGHHNIIVYLDDFLVVAPTKQECSNSMNVLISLLRKLGLAINWKKVDDPCNIITFLGIQLNSVNLSLSLPEPKLMELKHLLDSFKSKVRASKKQLQSLAGKLNWACRVVRGGRVYLRRVLNLMNLLNLSHHKTKLSVSFLDDIDWWIECLDTFNGKCMFNNSYHPELVHVDACTVGAGMAFASDWAYVNWDLDWPEVASLHINFKEVLAIVHAAQRWGHLWSNKRIIILTDSECAKAIIMKGTTRNDLIMKYLRQLFWVSVQFNFELECIHISGVNNKLPDTISRLHEKGQFFQLESLLHHFYGDGLHPLALRAHMSSKAIYFLILQIRSWLLKKLSWIGMW